MPYEYERNINTEIVRYWYFLTSNGGSISVSSTPSHINMEPMCDFYIGQAKCWVSIVHLFTAHVAMGNNRYSLELCVT